MGEMFCFQCEQAAGCTACTGKAGVCGKSAETAAAQDRLTGALIRYAEQLTGEGRAPAPEQALLLMQGLFTTITNVNFDTASVDRLTDAVHAASPGIAENYDMRRLWQEPDEDVRSLKCFVLFSLRGMAAYNYHARVLGRIDPELDRFYCEALKAIAADLSREELWTLVQKTGEANFRTMELLDHANTGAFGEPEPAEVPPDHRKGTVHRDLRPRSLRLPAAAGPDRGKRHQRLHPLRNAACPRLSGAEKALPPPEGQLRHSMAEPAAGVRGHPCPGPLHHQLHHAPAGQLRRPGVHHLGGLLPRVQHIGPERDFSPVIRRALELGGYPKDTLLPGMNGGKTVTTGFARHAVLEHADEIVQAVRDGRVRHFFLIGGCDGTRPSRRYYTELAKCTPPDTILLTLACGKFRLNDLPLGTVPGTGLPRILDVGQCNDAYSAIRIALALADAFGCSVNELPLSLVLCWFEQKAVCILIALLALGIRNIRLGPTLPPFLSPGVVQELQRRYDLKAITTPEEDLRAILGR